MLKHGLFEFALLTIFSGSCNSFFPEQEEIDSICRGQSGINRLALSSSCHHFIQCIYGVGRVYECDFKESCYSEALNRCVKSNECTCRKQEHFETFVKDYCHKNGDSWDLKLPSAECSSFYLCLGPHLDPVLIECPHGYHYSRVEETCVPPLQAGCQALRNMCKDKPTARKFPAAKCSEYYECNEPKEIPILRKCRAGHYFEYIAGECIPDTHLSCKHSGAPSDGKIKCTDVDVESGEVYQHEECNKFYECSGGVLKERTCLNGQYFSKVHKMCVEDADNKCKSQKA